jgi:chemotaxis protein MotA
MDGLSAGRVQSSCQMTKWRKADGLGRSCGSGRQSFAGRAAISCRVPAREEEVQVIETALRLFDSSSLLLVAGGSLLAAILRSTRADIGRALGGLVPLVRADPERDELIARRGLRELERIAELKGTACADHIETDSAFVRKAALRLADAPTAVAFAEWAADELQARADRHSAAAAVWRSAAEAAPSMGMIGTVLGLIGMFAAMDDPERMGPAMALAMLTTFYGLVLGTIVFGPVAARLERLSEAELGWQRRILASVEKLARAEACPAGEWLKRRSEAAE